MGAVGEELRENRSEGCEDVPPWSSNSKSNKSAPETAVAEASAGNWFSSICSQKAADDLNYTEES